MEVGMIWSESSGSGAGVSVTSADEKLDTIDPSGFFNSALIVLVPWLTPVTMPLPEASPVVTVATDGMLESHVICGELVSSSSRPLAPNVASAMNCPVWPEAETDWEPGTMVRAVYSSDDPPPPGDPLPTVKVAVF